MAPIRCQLLSLMMIQVLRPCSCILMGLGGHHVLWIFESRDSTLFTMATSCVISNHDKLGVSLRVLYCLVDTGYGLGRSLGDCRHALPEGRKYQMVKTQTESHIRWPIPSLNKPMTDLGFFPLRFAGGQLEFVTQV